MRETKKLSGKCMGLFGGKKTMFFAHNTYKQQQHQQRTNRKEIHVWRAGCIDWLRVFVCFIIFFRLFLWKWNCFLLYFSAIIASVTPVCSVLKPVEAFANTTHTVATKTKRNSKIFFCIIFVHWKRLTNVVYRRINV